MTLNNLKTDTFDSQSYKKLTPVMKEAINDIFKLIKNEGNLIFNFENAVEKIAEFHNINKKAIEEYFDRELEEQLGEK